MDCLAEDSPSREDRLIEDYLFANYKPANTRPNFEKDQQFAKPIEDEDIFGVGAGIDVGNLNSPSPGHQAEPKDNYFVVDDDEEQSTPLDGPQDAILIDSSQECVQIDDKDEQVEQAKQSSNIDEIFLDDYSCTSAENGLKSNQNTYQTSAKSAHHSSGIDAATGLTLAQLKRQQFIANIAEQARAMNLTPIKSNEGRTADGGIELEIDKALVSDSKTKFIFNKLFNRSKKASEHNSPSRDRLKWEDHKAELRKSLCAKKRKVWDSIYAPIETYDEDEELIEDQEGGRDVQDADTPAEATNDDAENDEKGDDDDDDIEMDDEDDQVDLVDSDDEIDDDDSDIVEVKNRDREIERELFDDEAQDDDDEDDGV